MNLWWINEWAITWIILKAMTNHKLVYQLSVDEGNGRREGDNRWRFERWPFVIRFDKGLTLETPAVVGFTASITLINTQLIHQFVSRRADAVT